MSFFVAFLCLVGLAVLHPSQAQNSQQNYVDAHNTARALVGVGNIVWDSTVAAYAQNYANARISDCSLVHSGGTYGENMAKGSGLTGTSAVSMWTAEKTYYNYSSNSCATGHICTEYTQVVWANSVKLGCARVQCTSGQYLVTCNYDVAGNVPGQSPY